ncbi:MAG: hypothetical protein PVJ55_01720 [Anaerolineae bacterium]|jgi:hypothetical protein
MRRIAEKPYLKRMNVLVRVAAALIAALPGCAVRERQPVEQAPGVQETAVPGPLIDSFTADAVKLNNGRGRIAFAWQTTGADSVGLRFLTRQRFFPSWANLPPDGTQVFEGETLYPDPDATLFAYAPEGRTAQEHLEVDWRCRHPYFFTSEIETNCPVPYDAARVCACPRHAAILTPAAEQPFGRGRMIWLHGSGNERPYPDTIVVLYHEVIHDGATSFRLAEIYEDTWTPDRPDRDPDVTPPAGRFQPIRGFGKVWREHEGVRRSLGWATAAGTEFGGAWQSLESDSLGGRDVFLRTMEGRTVL